MKYRTVLPEHNSNVSHQHPLREFLTLVVGGAIVLITVYWLLGFFIDIAVEYITPEMEMAIYNSTGLNEQDIETNERPFNKTEQATQKLLGDLTKCIDIEYPVDLRLEQVKQLNAYASPGGHIVVFSGLLDTIKSQNGVAFVLAHELAHFKHQDHLRSLGRSVVLMALSVLFTGANSDLSKLLTPVSGLETAQFSQTRESAADKTALQILNCHYGHIGGATEFFKVISAPDESVNFDLTHYFSSHPEIQKRIDDIQLLSQSMNYRVDQTIKSF